MSIEAKTKELIEEAVAHFTAERSKKEFVTTPDDVIRVFSFAIGDKIIDDIINALKTKQVEATATVELGPDDNWWNFRNTEERRA